MNESALFCRSELVSSLASSTSYLSHHSCQFAAAIPDRERPLSSVETACHGVTKLLQTINKLLQVVAK